MVKLSTADRARWADVLFTSAILSASFISGSAVVQGILLSLGANLASDQTAAAWKRIRELLFGEPQAGLLKDDLLDALARSFQRAVQHLEQQWWQTHRGNQIAHQPDSSQFEEIRSAFELLRKHTARFFETDRIQGLTAEGHVQQIFTQDSSEVETALLNSITQYLHGLDPGLVKFIQDNFSSTMIYWFGEELKTDSPASNRAWRLFQRLSLERIQSGQVQLLAGQASLENSLAMIQQNLQQLDQRLSERPPEDREQTGEVGLEDAIEKTGRTLLEAISRESDQTREQILASFDGIAQMFRDELKAALNTGLRLMIRELTLPAIVVSSAGDSIEEFRVEEKETYRLDSVFVEPPQCVELHERLSSQQKAVWIIGPAGVGKRTLALHLAQKCGRNIYRVPRSIQWPRLYQSGVRDSAVILPDALGAVGFERPLLDTELQYLEKLVIRGNWVIVTSPDSVYQEAIKWGTHLESSDPQPVSLKRTDVALAELYKKLVGFAYREQILSDSQHVLAEQLVKPSSSSSSVKPLHGERFRELLTTSWLPIDVDRFVFAGLPQVHTEADIANLLDQNTSTARRIHSWFMNLDDATRAFVLSLTIFAGLSVDEVRSRHQAIIMRLRARLDPTLPILPLSVLRHHAAPHITENGPVDFSNPLVFRASSEEVAKYYREYYVELLDLFEKWSIPELSKDEAVSDRILTETELLRNALARSMGDFGRWGLMETRGLLAKWAGHELRRIGDAAVIALRQTALESMDDQEIRSLLREWSESRLPKTGTYLRRSAALALAQVGTISGRPGLTDFSLRTLERLAADSNPYVLESVAASVRMIARTEPFDRVMPALEKLLQHSAKGDRWTTAKREVARALDEAVRKDRNQVLSILGDWASSGNQNKHWIASYAVLTGAQLRKRNGEVVLPCLGDMASTDPSSFLDAVQAALSSSRGTEADNTRSTLGKLTRSDEMLLCLVSSFHNALLTSPAAPVIEAFAKLGQGAWSEGRHLQKAVYDDVIGEVQRCQAAAESLRVRRAEMQAKRDRFVEVTAVKGSFASRIQQGWKAALAIVTGAALVALLAGAPLWTVMLVCLSLGALAGVGIWYHWRVLDQTRANVGCELGDLIGVPSEAGVSVEVAAEKAIERLDEEIAERQRALGLYQTTAGKLASLFTPDTTA